MMRTLLLVGLAAVATRASAQVVPRDTAAPTTLTIDQAIEAARRNNPELQQTLNNRIGAQAAVRSAYGQLLPSADASLSVQRQQGGQQIFSGTSLGASSDVNQSNYSIGFNYRLNSAPLTTPSLQRANRDAVEADITGATEILRSNVSQQYLTALQVEANADLQDSLVVAAQQELVLAQAREIVGSGTQLDVQRADVALGLQKVQALKARNQVEIEKLRLFQLMGTAHAASIRESNAKFPFSFTKSPRSITATLSLPIFDGFAREQRLQEAMASRSDARYGVRAKELALTADVTAAFLILSTAEKTVALQEQNAAKAKQELKLVQDRYRIGATTYVDLTQSRATYERAESDRINAIYDYHKAFAALESAVGHSLR